MKSASSPNGCPDEPTEKHYPARIRTLKQILDTRYFEPLNLDGFAEELHFNKFMLAKEFKQYYGMPPIEYLLDRRVQEACHLLHSTDMTVTDIGSKVGIGNIAYFIHIFERKVGSTPLTYRKHCRQTNFLVDRSLEKIIREPPM